MIGAVHAFEGDTGPAGRLAQALGVPLETIELHRFPDGEGLTRVAEASGDVVIYRSLDRPDDKLLPLLLAADALRRRGARRVGLAAPYMAYLRQDMVFHPGEPLSRDVLGPLLAERFDAIVTVDPHLHRTRDLTEVFGRTPARAVSAAGVLAEALGPTKPGQMVMGPDIEAQPLAQALAAALGAEVAPSLKVRRGDRDVELTFSAPVAGRPVVVVDDASSSGSTLEAAVKVLRDGGAAAIDLAVVHALYDEAAKARMLAAGARRIVATDSCSHPDAAAHLAPTLAKALKDLFA